METLRCKSPHLVVRELLMHMIAYNLVRHLMVCAEPMRPLEARHTLSFKGTLDRLDQWQWAIWAAPSARQARVRLAGESFAAGDRLRTKKLTMKGAEKAGLVIH